MCVQGISGDDLVWRDRTFPTKSLDAHLRDYRFSDHVTMHVDYACAKDIPACRQMALDSATRGDNVGLGEHDRDETFEMLTWYAEVFACRRSGQPEVIDAFILIGPSGTSRTMDPCIADLYIFRSVELTSDPEVLTGMMLLAARLTVLMDIGYTQMAYSVAANCRGHLSAARAEGFRVVATIPKSVKMAGCGFQDNLIMVKQLGLPVRMVRMLNIVTYSLFSPCLPENKNKKKLCSRHKSCLV